MKQNKYKRYIHWLNCLLSNLCLLYFFLQVSDPWWIKLFPPLPVFFLASMQLSKKFFKNPISCSTDKEYCKCNLHWFHFRSSDLSLSPKSRNTTEMSGQKSGLGSTLSSVISVWTWKHSSSLSALVSSTTKWEEYHKLMQST